MRATPIRRLGDGIPFVDELASSVAASARAQVYQQLANFQALPQRMNRVVAQLIAFRQSTPARGLDESARLSALEAATTQLQAQWASTNGDVTQAIQSLSNGGSLNAAGDVAKAIAGMALVTRATTDLEQQTRALITASTTLDATAKQQLLNAGAPGQLTVAKVLAWGVGGWFVLKLLRVL